MELEEVKFKTLDIGSAVVNLLKQEKIDTVEGLQKYFGLVENEIPKNVIMSITRLVANNDFIIVREALVPSQLGPVLSTIVLGSSQKLQSKKDENVTFHSFNTKVSATGIPPGSLLRVNNGIPFTVHHMTLKLEVTAGDGESRKTIIKNVYYGKEFILDL